MKISPEGNPKGPPRLPEGERNLFLRETQRTHLSYPKKKKISLKENPKEPSRLPEGERKLFLRKTRRKNPLRQAEESQARTGWSLLRDFGFFSPF